MIKLAFVITAAALALPAGALADQDPQPSQAPAVNQKAVSPDVDHCLTSTGTHVSNGETTCISANGRVYTRDDLSDTGSVDWASVLARDPSITMSHSAR